MSWRTSKLILLIALIFSWVTSWIFLTPYCGALFHCGCTWLWAGAAEKCVGAMDSACVMHQCPWCTDGKWGMYIPFSFMLASQTITLLLLWWKFRPHPLYYFIAGILTFLASGYLESIVHAWIKNYPR